MSFLPRYGHGKPPHPELYQIINQYRDDYALILKTALSLKYFFLQIKDAKIETDSTKPAWNNAYFPGLDIVTLYTLLAHFKPRRYLEIGSGNSTKVAYKAKLEQNLSTEIISIDPMPRVEIDTLANRIIRQPFENIEINLIDELEANDILFVDNSHRILPNSDAMVFFLEILPRLKKGVIVQIHDVYLPYDYPRFMCDRAYSEQYGLAIYLMANSQKYQPILPNYFIFEDPELSQILNPLWNSPEMPKVEQHGGSFWLQIQ